MHSSLYNRVRWQFFAVLFTAILMIIGAITYVIAWRTMDTTREHSVRELSGLAVASSLSITGDAHNSIITSYRKAASYGSTLNGKTNDGSPVTTKETGNLAKLWDAHYRRYLVAVRRLGAASKSTTGIRSVYTISRLNGRYQYILDPYGRQSEHHHPKDEKQSASVAGGEKVTVSRLQTVASGKETTPKGTNMLDNVRSSDIRPELKAAFAKGTVQVTKSSYKSQFGEVYTAYSPIYDSKGDVCAVLAVDRLASVQDAPEKAIKESVLLALLASMAAGFMVCWCLATKMAKGNVSEAWVAGKAMTRVALVETGLYTLVALIIGFGIYCFINSGRDLSSATSLQNKRDTIIKLKSGLTEATLAKTFSIEDFKQLEAEGKNAGVGYLVEDLLDRFKADPEIRADDKVKLEKAGFTLDREVKRIDQDEYDLRVRLANRNTWMAVCACIAALLSLLAIVSIRAMSRQQEVLLEAISRRDQMQAVYQQLVEQIPIGLFAYRSGKIDFCNPTWKNQIGVRDGADPWDAMLDHIHDDDQAKVVESLRWFEQERSEFQIELRYKDGNGADRFMECRGVPVFSAQGEYVYMLAFTLDTTDTVEARTELELKNNQLSQALGDLGSNFEATVVALVKAIDAKDPYTAGHSERVMQYSMQIGRKLNLSDRELHMLEMGTLIHDIGKIAVPDAILTKASSLTKEEFEVIKQHPQRGYNLIQGIPLFGDCAEIVLWHHERLDGTGYPHGLRGEQVPLLVRIAAVADSFDAMTSTRAYRKGRSATEALRELRKESLVGSMDIKVVEILAEIVESGELTVPADVREAA